VEYDPDLEGVVLTISQVLDNTTLRSADREAIAMAREHGCARFLTDIRGAELDLTTLQIYSSGDIFESAGMRSARRAIVARRVSAEVAFHETVSARRGHAVRVFTDVAEARAWLAAAADAG
jgi:hypothetical protein